MNKFFSKSLKYVPIFILIFELSYFGIPDFVKPIFIYEYALFFGFAYLLALLQDFFEISKKTSTILRICCAISALVILITSVFYQAILSIIFATIMFITCISLLILQKKGKGNKESNIKNRQKVNTFCLSPQS